MPLSDEFEAGERQLPNQHKARQRQRLTVQCENCGHTWEAEDREDRNLPFSNIMRQHGITYTDVDCLLSTRRNEILLLIDWTLCQQDSIGHPPSYCATIDERRIRQHNDSLLLAVAKLLNVRAVVVTAGRNVEHDPDAPLHWRWMDEVEWHHDYTAQQFLAQLKRWQDKRQR